METFFSKKNIFTLIFFNIIWILIYSSVTAFAIKYLNINWFILLAFGWAVWYTWHTFFFLRITALLQWLKIKNYYSILIFTQVSPGVSFFATLMLFPLIYLFVEQPAITTNFFLLTPGIFLIISGILLIYQSFRTIGIGGAAFENDYCDLSKNLVCSSVYSYVRHPLFVGAFIGSLGLNIVVLDAINIFFPVVHLVFFPIYKKVEEDRLIEIYGEQYIEYRKKVNAFIPKKNRILNNNKFYRTGK